MKLAEWRRSKGLTQQNVADGLGCVLATIARYEAGSRMPEPQMVVDIFCFTNGAVQPNDFYDLPNLPAAIIDKAA